MKVLHKNNVKKKEEIEILSFFYYFMMSDSVAVHLKYAL